MKLVPVVQIIHASARHRESCWALILIALTVGLVEIILVATSAHAHSYKLADISIGHIWSPPVASAGEGAPIYGALLNRGAKPVRLIRATSPIAEQVEFRTGKDGNAQWLKSIQLEPAKPLGLAPWQQHIWLSGLKRPLKEGDSFELTLDFGLSGSITIKVVVESEFGHRYSNDLWNKIGSPA